MIDPTIPIALIVIAINIAAALKYRSLFKKYKLLYDEIIKPKPKKTSPQAIEAQSKHQQWLEIRSKILLRDHFRCQECNYYKHLEVHHIVPKSKGGTDDPSNLITLCKRCHDKKHGIIRKYGKHTRRNQRKKFRRYLNKNSRKVFNQRFPIRSFEDVHPRQEDLSPEAVIRRQKLYEKWQRNELNQT